MKQRGWLFLGVVLAVFGAAMVAVTRMMMHRHDVELQEQIRLARAAGLPTNAAEFAATIPHAILAENAAPLYRRLPALRLRPFNAGFAADQLDFTPSQATRQVASDALTASRPYLEVVDAAVARPRCWFDRDWSQGAAVILPEYAEMKEAARMVALRGSVAADRGDSRAALADVDRMFQIAGHAGEEPLDVSDVVREQIYQLGCERLASWAFVHRDRPEYRAALEKALGAYPKPNFEKSHRADLFMNLWLADGMVTPKARAMLGLREENVPVLARLLPLSKNQPGARAKIIEGERRYWAAFQLPPNQRDALQADAVDEYDAALDAFPLAKSIHEALFVPPMTTRGRENANEGERIMLTAALRALSAPNIAVTIPTADLKSPFDGKPLKYRFDGKQLTIDVRAKDAESIFPPRLQFPPDAVLHPPAPTRLVSR